MNLLLHELEVSLVYPRKSSNTSVTKSFFWRNKILKLKIILFMTTNT